MIENGRGPKRGELTSEMLISSQKVLSRLGGKADLETVGKLTGTIAEATLSRHDASQILDAAGRNKPRFSSQDVKRFTETLTVLGKHDQLPEDIDREDLDDALDTMKDRLRSEEARRTQRKVAAVALPTTALLVWGGVEGVKTIENNAYNKGVEADNAITLIDTPSSPSFSGWTIETVSPEKRFAKHGETVTLGEHDSVFAQVGNETVDTGIELKGYTRTDGKDVVKVLLPSDDPYTIHLFGLKIETFRKPDGDIRWDEKLLSGTSQVVDLIDGKGNHEDFLISQTTNSKGEMVDTVTPVREDPEAQ